MITCFHGETPQAVRDILTRLCGTRRRIRLFLGDAKTGEAWAEEFHTVGHVSNSTGRLKIPLLIHNARSTGGGAILDHCIVAIKEGGAWLYRHPGFTVGEWTEGKPTSEGYTEAAYHNGGLHAQFKKAGAAARYIAFMTGERMAP